MPFTRLKLIDPLLRAVFKEGYKQPTPIQELAIPHLLEGKDLLGCAQTGTGKTAAFALPILQRLGIAEHNEGHRPIRALILTPTRELAAQIDESFAAYGRFTQARHAVVYGGVKQAPQERALKKGADILTATPGRLLDLMRQGIVRLGEVEVFVLDEADRMLDMGFIDDVREIISHLPKQRQTLLFSATMPREIRFLADSILREPVEVRVAPESPAAMNVEHAVYLVERRNKQALLEHLLSTGIITRALVFTRTKRAADRVTQDLKAARIRAEVMHGDRTQRARESALENFKRGRTRVLVASDIASRGLDVDDISHVINFDMPADAKTYIHRIGRTGRAGASGVALSFCTIDERHILNDIEETIRKEVVTISEHPYPSPLPHTRAKKEEPAHSSPKFGHTKRMIPRGRRLGRRR
jgi:ATP-dependent RNA helicase RhlE